MGGIGSLIGGIIGGGEQSSDDAQAAAVQQQVLQNLQNIKVPTIEEQQLQLALEQNSGQLSPQQEGTEQIQGNALSNITNNPQLLAAQMGALQSLQQQGTQGISASDKAALQQVTNQQEQTANSQNQGTLQQFAQRGQGGSGANLAAELANNQNSANNANQRGLTIAGQAQQNALQATAGAGNLGQSMEAQQYGQAANAASAQNAINQFNTQNSQAVLGTNTQAANQAQAYNLNNAQTIANQNVGLQNQQQQYNKGLYQQQFQDELSKATGAVGAAKNLGATEQLGGADANKNALGIGNSAGQVATGAFTAGSGLFGGGVVLDHYAKGGMVRPQLNHNAIAALLAKMQANKLAHPQLNMTPPQPSMPMPQQAPMPTQSPQALSKGGMARPPTPGNPMSMFKMLNKGGEASCKEGGKVPGKAKVKGDSPENDTVKAKLSPGELVIPRSMVNQPDNVIMDFINAAKAHAKGSK